MPIVCEICSKVFKQKGHYDAHRARKVPCKQDSAIGQVVQQGLTHTKTVLKKQIGQYFTVSEMLQQFVFDKVKHRAHLLLEPAFGAGHLLKKFMEYDQNYPILCYELDDTIKPIMSFNKHQIPIYGDFTKQTIAQKFKTIIGNPPYVKQSTGNLYIRFIEQCYHLLDEGGEMIFIVPSDFIKLTSASTIIDTMTKSGSFTDFLFPHDEKLFEGASIDVLVFRYEKGVLTNETNVNGSTRLCNVNNGIITFSDGDVSGTQLSDMFNVYVGIVSGRDEIYRMPFGNISVLSDKDRVEKFIFVEEFPSNNQQIDEHLLTHKNELGERKIKKFSEKNWFEWGAPRNITSIHDHWGKPCIYVRNITRKEEVAFVGTVQYFGGGLLCLIPKSGGVDLEKIVQHMNTKAFQKDYKYAGRFKIGHKQVSNAIIQNL
jgi:adenine-specific DNA-methyltransferase